MLRKKRTRGLTLIEAVLAIAMIAIVALGTLTYQYYGARHIRISQVDLIATRIGQLLLEDWKSVGGISAGSGIGNYNPTSLGLDFTPEGSGYLLNIDDVTLHITLASDQIYGDGDFAGKNYAGILRKISTTIRWRNDFGSGAISADSPSLVLTTYVRPGQN
jgi:type II secretory pathway pseudopilin PulG